MPMTGGYRPWSKFNAHSWSLLNARRHVQSHRAPVYYVDLCLRDGISLEEAVAQAQSAAAEQEEAGINIAALELAARTALANGAFEDSEEEIPAIVEEFYPEVTARSGDAENEAQAGTEVVAISSNLADRLGAKARKEATC